MVSIENLFTFPFVQKAIDDNELTLHALWTDIAEGTLEQFDTSLQSFVQIKT
jgi:carbonic anhydrase